MLIIGLSGKSSVGKTTLANYLKSRHGFQIVSIASPLKHSADMFFPGIHQHKKDTPYLKYDWTPREFMINLGKLLRYHDNDYWINQAVSTMTGPKAAYVLDDVRFKNEADKLKSLDAKIVRINRYKKDRLPNPQEDDISETDLDHYAFDYIVPDCVNTSLKNLYNQGDNIVDTFY